MEKRIILTKKVKLNRIAWWIQEEYIKENENEDYPYLISYNDIPELIKRCMEFVQLHYLIKSNEIPMISLEFKSYYMVNLILEELKWIYGCIYDYSETNKKSALESLVQIEKYLKNIKE